MVARCVRQVVILMIVCEFAWADSALVILDKCSSYRGGCMSRFDCISVSIYEHHAQNTMHFRSVDNTIWLQINKAPTIQAISEDFNNQWNTNLYDSEKHLEETLKVVEKAQIEFNKNLEVNYPHNYKKEKNLIIKWNEKIKRKLETKQRRKWINLKTRDLLLIPTSTKGPTIE